ncbi:MAG TPA: RNA polymerase sigma factor [Gaiellales bacterium]|jgi:RNA polymerase sigma-70 factor (ECF subfamily)
MEPRDEPELIARARRGDGASYAQLVAAHRDVAFRAAYLVTGGAAEAEDAAQEGFVKAFRSLGRFRDGAPFRPWLLTIVTNEARNRRRSEGRRSALALRVGEEQRDAVARSAEDEALARVDREQLLRAVERLRPSDREIVSYRYLLGLDEAETAQALGCARGTVKSRLSRALERLRRELDPNLGGSRA